MIPWYKSKTIWFNLLLLATAVASLFGFLDYTPSPQASEIIAVVVSVVNLILRLISTTIIRSFKSRG